MLRHVLATNLCRYGRKRVNVTIQQHSGGMWQTWHIAKFAMFFQILQRGAPNLSYDASGGERCERARPGTAVSFGDLTTFLDADVRFAPWTACPLVPRVNQLHPPDLQNLFLLFWFLASSEVHCAALDDILMIGSIIFAE